jgi:zinc/manganese transport system permease protein
VSLELQIVLPGFLACLLLTGFLAYLGLHVLARGVIFVDIALAQIAALGTACASFNDIEPHTLASYGVSLAFTFAGAALFALTRGLRQRVPQEAFIGIAYAVAAAAAILVARFLPHGDEEIKEILIGSLLTVSLREVGVTAVIFAVLAVVHVIFRRKFLALSFNNDDVDDDDDGWRPMLWDLLFYATFGVVITSSVQMAGVLLVFSFLIVPAVFSALFAKNLWTRLLMAWSLGAVVSALGLWGSFKLDLPTGAAVVVTFGIVLALAAVVRAGLSWRAR